MPQKETVFNIKGMQRDNSEATFNPQFAYENMNMRIEARDKNNQFSMHNEIGNKVLEILDAGNNIVDDTILGIPIGYTVLDDYVVLFTTDTVLDTTNYDEADLNNLKNTFKINSIQYSNLTSSSLFLKLNISEIGFPTLLDKLKIELTVSFVRKLDDTDHYEAPITLQDLIAVKTGVQNEYQFSLPNTHTFYNKSVSMVINKIKVSYITNSILSYKTNVFININDFTVITNLSGLQSVSFPIYNNNETSLLDATIVSSPIITSNLLNIVGGSIGITGGAYTEFFTNTSIHTHAVTYYVYSYVTNEYVLNNSITSDADFEGDSITQYLNGLILTAFYPIIQVTGFVVKYSDYQYGSEHTLNVGYMIPIYLAQSGIQTITLDFIPSDATNRNITIIPNGANIKVVQTMQKGTSPVWITVVVTGSGYITVTSVQNPSISRQILFNKLNY